MFTAKHWRARAEEVRTELADFTNMEARLALESVARDYDILAYQAECSEERMRQARNGYDKDRPWAVVSTQSGLHIVPTHDVRTHELKTTCWCTPLDADGDSSLWVHNAKMTMFAPPMSELVTSGASS